jgi:hypothetical protein
MERIGFFDAVPSAPPACWSTPSIADAVSRDADQAYSFSATLLAMAGHDLRQPLQVITSAHDVLARTFAIEEQREELRRAEKATKRLAGMLGQRRPPPSGSAASHSREPRGGVRRSSTAERDHVSGHGDAVGGVQPSGSADRHAAQPDTQRDRLHASRRRRVRHRSPLRFGAAHRGARHRRRHPSQRAAGNLQGLPAGRRKPAGRARAWALHRETSGGFARTPCRGPLDRGARLVLHHRGERSSLKAIGLGSWPDRNRFASSAVARFR